MKFLQWVTANQAFLLTLASLLLSELMSFTKDGKSKGILQLALSMIKSRQKELPPDPPKAA